MMAGEEGGGSEEGGGFGAGEAGKGRTGAGRGREGSERLKRKHSVPPPGSSSLHVVGTVIRFVLPPTCNDDGPIGRWCGGSHFKLYRPTPLPLQASQIIAAHFQGFVIGQGVVGSHCTSPHLLPLQVRSPQPAVCPPPRCSLLAEEWRVLLPPLPPRAWVQWSGEGGGCGGSCCHHCCQGPGCSGQVRGGGVAGLAATTAAKGLGAVVRWGEGGGGDFFHQVTSFLGQ